MSLDGYIAGPNGEADWILPDPEIDFAAIWAQFDTFLMGRHTYEAAKARLGESAFTGPRTVVASRTLPPQLHPGISVIPDLTKERLAALRQQAQKDIWLLGGSQLAGTLFNLGEIDGIDLSIIPVLLGSGLPLTSHLPVRQNLTLLQQKVYRSGILHINYAVQR